jgi:hypothetical protein
LTQIIISKQVNSDVEQIRLIIVKVHVLAIRKFY